MQALPVKEFVEQIHEMRISASAFKLGQSNSRWRKSPASGAFYGRDVQISEAELFTSYAVVSELLLTHPHVENSLRAAVSGSSISKLRPSGGTDDPELNRMLETDWGYYADNPLKSDVEGKLDYYQLRAQAFYLNRAYGDCVALIMEDGRLQTCEPWRLRSPSRSEKYGQFGIKKDAQGLRAQTYYLTKLPRSIYEFIKIDDVQAYDAVDEDGEPLVLHPVEPGRKATRGISRLAPVGDTLGMGQDLFYGEFTRQQLSSSLAFSNEISAVDWQILQESGLLSKEAFKDLFDLDARKFKMNPAAILQNLPGFQMRQPMASINPANSEFLWKEMKSMLAVALDIPRNAAELDMSDSNYAQFRAILILMRERNREIHSWWTSQYDRPCWRHFVRRLVADVTSMTGARCREYLAKKMNLPVREIDARLANGWSDISEVAKESLLAVRWDAPGAEYTQPVHEATGDAITIAEGLVTLRKWAQTNHQMSWDTLSSHHVEDRVGMYRKVFNAKLDLLTEFGMDEATARGHVQQDIRALHYTEFCPIARPKTAYATLPVEIDPPKPPEKPAPAKAAAPAQDRSREPAQRRSEPAPAKTELAVTA